MSRSFPSTPGPAYRVFLARLVEARIARGHSLEQLSEIIGLTPQQIASFEAGAHPLTFTDTRNWLLALDVPWVQFTREMEEVLDTTLTTDEGITFPEDLTPNPERYARAARSANHSSAFLRARRRARSPHHRQYIGGQASTR